VHTPRLMTASELQKGMIECFDDFYTYMNAFNDAVEAACGTISALFRSLYTKPFFPSFYPSFMKMAGHHLVRQFVRQNQHYFAYLKQNAANRFQKPAPAARE